MNETAPLTTLIDSINNLVLVNSNAIAGAIVTLITPVVALGFSIYTLFIAINYMRGQNADPIGDLTVRFMSWAIVLGIGFNVDTYTATVIPIVTGLGADLATAFPGSSFTENSLDTLALQYVALISEGFIAAAEGSWFDSKIGDYFMVSVKTAVVLVGLVPFLVFGTAILVIANIGLAIVATIGPLFFAFALFPATRQYFSAWLNTAFSYALMPLIVTIIAGVSLGLSEDLMVDETTGLLSSTFDSVLFATFGNLILLLVLKQVSSIASSLSAGGINASIGSAGAGAAAFSRPAAGAVSHASKRSERKDATASRKEREKVRKEGGVPSQNNSIKAG